MEGISKGIYQKIVDKEAIIAVIGLGYVGLPLALSFAKKFRVIGFDISESRVEMMRKKLLTIRTFISQVKVMIWKRRIFLL